MPHQKYQNRPGGTIQNRRCKIAALTLALVLSAVQVAHAGGDAGRESPFAFGAGARGMAMGRAFAALSGDASAPFWNPAATAMLDRSEAMAFHTTLFLDTRYDCFGLSHPINEVGAFSILAARLGSDKIEQRDINNISNGTFSASESQFGISYARNIAFGIAGGITFKANNQKIGGLSGTGYGMDLGFRYMPEFFRGFALGIAVNDLVRPGIKLESSEDRYQTISRFGASYIRDFSEKVSAMESLELTSIPGKSIEIHAGVELKFYRYYSIRAGFDKDRASFGAGMVYNFVKLDYAFENIQYLGGSHRISIGFTFGKSITRSREDARARIIEQERANWVNTLETERRSESERLISAADSLKSLKQYQEALVRYQKAFVLDSTLTRAQLMADSMIFLIKESAVASVGDERRKQLIADRIGSAIADYKNGLYNESISKLNLLLEIDPGNTSVTDLMNSVRETRRKEIADRANIARSYQGQGDYINAIAQWNRLLTLDRNNAEARQQIADLEKQVRADRLITDAVAAMKERKYTQAMGYLRQAREIRPGDRTINSLIDEAGAKAAPPTTLEDIKKSSSNWNQYLSGLESYQSGDYAEALRIWNELRKSYPNNPELDSNIDQARQRLAAEGGR